MKVGVYLFIWLILNLILVFLAAGFTVFTAGLFALPCFWIITVINIALSVYFIFILDNEYKLESKIKNSSCFNFLIY